MSETQRPILVAAFGNELAGDDAFGPLVADALRDMACAGVEVISLGMKPASLLGHLADRAAVCVVDAVCCDDSPVGSLIEVDFFASDRPPLVHDRALSTHGLSVADELNLARQLGLCPPHVRLVAAVIGSVEVGRPISPEVLRQVPAAARSIMHRARQWLAEHGLSNPACASLGSMRRRRST